MTVMTRPLPIALPGRPRPVSAAPAANATLVRRLDLTADLAVFAVSLDSPLGAYVAGQYVSVGVIDGLAVVKRPYSVVPVGHDRQGVELFVRRIARGNLSTRLWSLPMGSRIRVGPARGLFMLDRTDPRPRLFIATGTGLAPFVAMLDVLAREDNPVRTTLIHAVSHVDELAFTARIKNWIDGGLSLDFRPTVSRPDDARNIGWTGLIGRAERQLTALLAEEGAWAGYSVAYLCGNPEMISECASVLLAAGMRRADIRTEQFHAPERSRDRQGGTGPA